MRSLAALVTGLLACGCGIKAPPRPPGVPAAVRGEEGAPCDGCQIPGPDAYPAPSTPSPSPATTPAGPLPPSLEGTPPGLPGTPEIPKAPEEGAPTVDPEPAVGPPEAEPPGAPERAP
ncbi:MAG TPA: hypothetical protein VGD74_03125 [Vulgatibacter sp.]